MKIIYIADDGTQFDDEFACKDYEWVLNHPHLKDVHIFDKDGNEFKDIFSEDAYNYSTKIVVANDKAAKDLQDLAGYTGYCYYGQINKYCWPFWNQRHQRHVQACFQRMERQL